MKEYKSTISEKDLSDFELLQETKNLRIAKSSTYVKKKDKYEDLGSTAVVFISFGIVGDIVVILCALGILHLPIANTRYSQITTFLLLTTFLVIGVLSWVKAKNMKSEISEEEEDTKRITDWMKEHISTETLSVLDDDTVADEIIVLNKLTYIKELILEQFPDADSDYVDMLAEEYFNSIF